MQLGMQQLQHALSDAAEQKEHIVAQNFLAAGSLMLALVEDLGTTWPIRVCGPHQTVQ